jgi:amino acid adenylation domain-containing protein
MTKKPIQDHNIDKEYALSPAQAGLFYDANGECSKEVEHICCVINGALDVEMFSKAWMLLVRSQPVLRTAFKWDSQGQPKQVVYHSVPFSLEVLDSSVDAVKRISKNQQDGFDLGQAPLFRVSIAPIAPSSWKLIFCHHHIILDGWSLPICFSHVMKYYEELSSGVEPSVSVSYVFKDYIEWITTRDDKADLAYWQSTMSRFTSANPIGTSTETSPAVLCEYTTVLPSELGETILRRSSQLRVTPNVITQVAWALTLAHYTGSNDVLFGITLSGRPEHIQCIDSAVGLFLTTQPIRYLLQPDEQSSSLLKRIQCQLIDLSEHQYGASDIANLSTDIPLGKPLYDSVFIFENYPLTALELTAGDMTLDLASVEIDGGKTRFALVSMLKLEHTAVFRLIYDEMRLQAEDVEQLSENYQRILALVSHSFDHNIGEIIDEVNYMTYSSWRGGCAETAEHSIISAPLGETEQQLAEIWNKVFGSARVDRHADFFDSGGHSLAAVRLSQQIGKQLHSLISPQTIFEKRTFQQIAKYLDQEADRVEGQGQGITIIPDPSKRYETFPLNDIQRAYWLGGMEFFDLGGLATICAMEMDIIAASVTHAHIEEAWNIIVKRHDMLRAVIYTDATQQSSEYSERIEVPRFDYSNLTGETLEKELAKVRLGVQKQVSDISTLPLFMVAYFEFSSGHNRLHIVLDTIVCDAGSLQVLCSEFTHLLYTPDIALPKLSLNFRDCVMAEYAFKETAEYAQADAYWEAKSARLPLAPQLPKLQDKLESGMGFTRRKGGLELKRWNTLKEICKASRVTPSVLLLTIYAKVLSHWSQTTHFTINVTLFNRLPIHSDVENVVGDFTTLNLLEIDARSPGTFSDWVNKIQNDFLTDLNYRCVSGLEVLKKIARVQSTKGPVLMPVVFTSTLGVKDGGVITGEIFGKTHYGLGQTPQTALDCQIIENDGELEFWWDTLENYYRPDILDQMFDSYCTILNRLLDEKGLWQADCRSLLAESTIIKYDALNHTSVPREPTLLHELFIHQVQKSPNAIAVINADKSLSYTQVDHMSTVLAHQLVTAGASKSRLVGVVMKKGWQQVVAAIAILKAGGAYLPVDIELPVTRRNQLLSLGEVNIVITQPEYETLADWPDSLSIIAVEQPALENEEAVELIITQDHSDLAYVLFTSGSTGVPKGVMLSHQGPVNTILDLNRRLDITRADRSIMLSSLNFDLSVYDIFAMLAAGAAVVIPEPTAHTQPSVWLELMEKHRVTIWNSVPAFMQLLVDYLERQAATIPTTLRHVLLGGDAMAMDLPQRLNAVGEGVCLHNLGGATETSIHSFIYSNVDVAQMWKNVPFGRPLENQRFYLLKDDLSFCPEWVPGELCVAGDGLAIGYWNDVERTAESFFLHPVVNERVYNTGDLARIWEDGTLEFLGRKDKQVKINGIRIELNEIEYWLNSHPDVLESVVCLVQHEKTTSKYLVGYVVPNTGAATANLNVTSLRNYLSEKLPWPVIPVDYVTMAALPLSSNGKIDRESLPQPELTEQPSGSTAPCSTLEINVTKIWAEFLGIDVQQIGVYDNFYMLGGDSMIATQVVTEIKKRLHVDLPLSTLYSYSDIRSLSEHIEKIPTEQNRTFSTIKSNDELMLSKGQLRIWLLEQNNAQDGAYNPSYNVPASLRIQGPLMVDALENALRTIVNRHAPLRSRYSLVDKKVVQYFSDVEMPELVVEDFCRSIDAESLLQEQFFQFTKQRFDLNNGPVYRFKLLRFSDNHHVLLVNIHHIACDAWSLMILAEELCAYYNAEAGHSNNKPEPLGASYYDYVLWEQRHTNAESLRAWWKGALRDLPVSANFPKTRNAPKGLSDNEIPFTLNKNLSHALRSMASESATSLYTVLMSAVSLAIRYKTAQQDITLGTSVANRPLSEFSGMVGCFVNVIIMRVDQRSNPTFKALINRVQDFVLGALNHQELPFEDIVAMLQKSDKKTALSPFVAMFVLQNTPTPQLAFKDLNVDMLTHSFPLIRYPLHIHLTDGTEELFGSVRFDPELVSKEDAVALLKLFKKICSAATNNPEEGLDELLEQINESMLSESSGLASEDGIIKRARRRTIAISEIEKQ